MPSKLLLIEDDPSTASALQKVLQDEGYHVDCAARGDTGLTTAESHSYALVITDLKLPGLSGMELVARLRATRPKVPIIIMTAHGTTDTAIEATKLGAYEYLVKPFEADELLNLVATAVAQSQLMSEPVELGESGGTNPALIGRSRAMQSIYKEIGRVAATPVTVLIRGDTGTGKELIARAIYHHSDRAHKPFIAVNCAAIPDTLLESELFGHESGAFTDAKARRIGRFEQAHGGTIFLDEIGDLSSGTQAKLLRVLQDKTIRRVGGDNVIPVDVRVLAATHRDLEADISNQKFREDLFYRLSVATIRLPSLNERREDIPELVSFFLRRYARELRSEARSIHPDALEWLQAQRWPGNVRELENIVRQALLLYPFFTIGLDQIREVLAKGRKPQLIAGQSHSAYIAGLLGRVSQGEEQNAYSKMISDLESELFRQAIQLAGGNQAKAARWLGVTRLKMREKLIQLGLHHPHHQEFDGSPEDAPVGKI